MKQVKYPTREELDLAYRALSSDEIAGKLAAGGLTETAREVAAAELARRRLGGYEPEGADWFEQLTQIANRLRRVVFWGLFVLLLAFDAFVAISSPKDLVWAIPSIPIGFVFLANLLYPESGAQWMRTLLGIGAFFGAVMLALLGMYVYGFTHYGGG